MDIFLAIAIAFVTALSGYVGVHVTLHPAETDAAKRNYKIVFGGLTLLACGLILWQGILNRREQTQLHSQLNKIQKNTEQAPTVSVNVPSPPVTVNIPPGPKQRAIVALMDMDGGEGIRLFVDKDRPQLGWMARISCRNISGVVARRVACAQGAWLIPAEGGAPNEKTEKEYWSKFAEWESKNHPSEFSDLDPGSNRWATILLHMLEVDPELNTGGKVIFIAGSVVYSDDAGNHKKEFCKWAQPPFNPMSSTWHFCKIGHNRELY